MNHAGVFRTPEAARSYLLRQDGAHTLDPTSTLSSGRLRGAILSTRAGVVVRAPIDAPLGDMLNDESSDEQRSRIWSAMEAFPMISGLVREGYAVRPLSAGTSGEIDAADEHFVFSGCERDGDEYFDLEVLSCESLACFSHRRAVAGLVHSGDQTTVKSCGGTRMLLHTLSSVPQPRGETVVVCLVGYNKKPLVEFAPFGPFAALVDRASRTVLYMPLSLSHAAVGRSTLLAPLMFKREGCRVRYVVPEVPVQYPSVNTGEYPKQLREMVLAESAKFDATFARLRGRTDGSDAVADRPGHGAEASAASPPASTHASPLASSLLASTVTVMLQDGLPAPDAPWSDGTCCLCRLGSTLDVSVPSETPPSVAASPFTAPIVGGTAIGAQKSLLLCTRSPSSRAPWGLTTEEWVEHATRVPTVLYVTDRTGGGVREADVGASCWLLNGILVIVGGGLGGPGFPIVERLDALVVPATRLMGAMSVVLYFDREAQKHYFVRGAAGLWRMFALGVAIGDEVEFSVRALAESRESRETFLGSALLGVGLSRCYLVPQGDSRVAFGGSLVDAESVLAAVRGVTSYADLDAMRGDLRLALVQLGVVLDSAQMRDTKNAMLAICTGYADRLTEPIAAKRRAIVARLLDGEPCDAHALSALKFEEREARREVQALADEIWAACSVRSASSGKSAKTDLQTERRRSQIESSVARAEGMSATEYAEMISDVPFFAIAELAPSIVDLLRAAGSTDAMEAYLVAYGCDGSCPSAAALARPTRLPGRMPTLDGDTIAVILDTPTAGHVLRTEGRLSIAFAMAGRGGLVCSFLPFAISKKALEWEGGGADWMRLSTDETEQVTRVAMRGIFAGIREFSIGAGSHQLTVALVVMMLSLMESICEGSGSSGVATRDDTKQQMLRGLMYALLCASASGASPALWVFQLTQEHATQKAPRTTGEWNLYAGVLRVLREIHAPPAAREQVLRGACKLLATSLRRYTDPLTEPMRSAVRADEAVGQVEAHRKRDRAWQWSRAVTLFFRACEPVRPVPVEPECGFSSSFLRLAPIEAALRPVSAGILASARFDRFEVSDIGRRDLELVRALRCVEVGGGYDEARVREIGAEYFAARSGAFAEAKRATMTALSVAPLDERVAVVAAFLGVGTVRVSNYAAFAALDHKRMAGDDELSRTARTRGVEAGIWCGCPTRGYERMGVFADDTWRGLLRRAGIAVGPLGPVGPVDHEGLEDHAGLEDGRPGDPSGDRSVDRSGDRSGAVARAVAEVGTVSLDEIAARGNLPPGPIARMFATLGLDADDARAVIRLYLREWRDVGVADARATDLLARASARSAGAEGAEG
jgi:hypothetical protein